MQKLRKNNMRQWQEFTFTNNNLSTPFILQNLLDFNTNGKISAFLFRKRVRNVLLCVTSHLMSVDISWLTPNKYIFRFETAIPKSVAVVCTPVANIQWDEYGCWTYWWHIDLQWQTDLWHQWWFCPRFSLHLFHTTNTLRHYKTFPNVWAFITQRSIDGGHIDFLTSKHYQSTILGYCLFQCKVLHLHTKMTFNKSKLE